MLATVAVTTLLRGRATILLLLALVATSTPAGAAPPTEESNVAIPPDREASARELLAPLLIERSDGLELRGPSIERDRIKWWLMRDGEARGMLLLVPHHAGRPEEPRSKSFAIRIAWPPEVDPEPAETALLESAVETVQARDQGGFYVLLFDALLLPEDPPPTSPDHEVDDDPDHVRLLWSLKLAGVALLVGFGLAVTLRPHRPSDCETETEPPD